ncbi:hypothetical protein [Paenibacillus polymyxa]|uniref:hypothetical protein n=1 Tax=Paenibacillus polymyxa TaxID=1406 RepID=UPI001ABB6E22|nr:hypothetical protein [Paenibacillus polymyxa]MBO3284761.1 hypothetical protein [Paenibacillus polymyxa]
MTLIPNFNSYSYEEANQSLNYFNHFSSPSYFQQETRPPKVMQKNLFTFEYPEFKVTTCVTGWTNVPCPTFTNPGRMCKQDIKLPCTQTRKSRFRVYAEVIYPESLEAVVRREVEQCHLTASGLATETIYAAATASSVVGPQATISAAIGAIPAALKVYMESFTSCIKGINMSDTLRREIKADIKRSTTVISDWRFGYEYDGLKLVPAENQQ